MYMNAGAGRTVDYAYFLLDGRTGRDTPFATVCHDERWPEATCTRNTIIDAIEPGLEVSWKGPVAVYIGIGDLTCQPESSRNIRASDMKHFKIFLRDNPPRLRFDVGAVPIGDYQESAMGLAKMWNSYRMGMQSSNR